MKPLILITTLIILASTASGQTKPDTTVVIHTTNNKLYQLTNLVQYSLNKLSDSSIPSNELKELNKQFQEVLQPMLIETRRQVVKVDTAKKGKGK